MVLPWFFLWIFGDGAHGYPWISMEHQVASGFGCDEEDSVRQLLQELGYRGQRDQRGRRDADQLSTVDQWEFQDPKM